MNSLPITPTPRISSHTFSYIPSSSSTSGFLLRKQFPALADCFMEVFYLEKASKLTTGVVQFLSRAVEAGQLTVDMEWCQGGDLQTEVENRALANQPFSTDYLFGLAEQMLTTLKQLHSQRIAHRHICLRHWVLQGTAVKLIDFSCAKLIKKNETVDAHTLRNARANTSPEVLKNVNDSQVAANDPFKEDIWALGKVLYELATCKLYVHLNSKPMEVVSIEVQQHLHALGYAQFAPAILAMLAWGRTSRVTASEALSLLRNPYAPQRADAGFISNEDPDFHFELLE